MLGRMFEQIQQHRLAQKNCINLNRSGNLRFSPVTAASAAVAGEFNDRRAFVTPVLWALEHQFVGIGVYCSILGFVAPIVALKNLIKNFAGLLKCGKTLLFVLKRLDNAFAIFLKPVGVQGALSAKVNLLLFNKSTSLWRAMFLASNVTNLLSSFAQ
jgi:hypothetical protein